MHTRHFIVVAFIIASAPAAFAADRCQQISDVVAQAAAMKPKLLFRSSSRISECMRARPTSFVYFSIMAHWPQHTVLRNLESLRHSPDPGTRNIIEETLEIIVNSTNTPNQIRLDEKAKRAGALSARVNSTPMKQKKSSQITIGLDLGDQRHRFCALDGKSRGSSARNTSSVRSVLSVTSC